MRFLTNEEIKQYLSIQKDMRCIQKDPLLLPEDIKACIKHSLINNSYELSIDKLAYLIEVEEGLYLISWGTYCELCVKRHLKFKSATISYIDFDMYRVCAKHANKLCPHFEDEEYRFSAIGFIEINVAELATLLL